ncbi:MAG: transcriptional regulator, LysR family [Firmicutes bacterium]|nr:transcriptional regulator, LysR family [Bacillota bacterium]
MEINFELYKVFYHVAHNRSFSEAANRLFISQSAVSQSIKQLETLLHCKLFFRHTKHVKLTQEGETLFRHIEPAFHFIKAGERGLSAIHSLHCGEIRIGASDTICKHYLLPFLKQFNTLYPEIRINVINRTSPACIDLLQQGIVDLSIINLPPQAAYKNMTVHKWQSIHDTFIAGNSYAQLKGRILEPHELENLPLLILEANTTTRIFFDDFLKKNKLTIQPEIELGSIDLLVEMAKIGLGVSFVIREYIAAELEKDEVFPLIINTDFPERYIGLVTNNTIPLSLAARRFSELLGLTMN